jgi:hypothetical protein
MDKVFSQSQIARMLRTDIATVRRLQAGGLLDRVSTSSLKSGVSESSLQAYLSGRVATTDRMLRLGSGR